MSVLQRCLSCRESNKGSKETQGPTVGVCLIGVFVKSESTVAWVLRLTQSVSGVIQILGSLSNDDGDVNENGKKAIGLDWQNNNFARASHLSVHFFAVTARLRREITWFHVLWRA